MQSEKKEIPRALLVEDELMQKKIMGNFLSQLDYQVDIVDTVESAQRQIQAIKYNVILLDLGLPDQSGEAIIEAVRDSFLNKWSILFVTSICSNSEIQRRCLDLGADMVFVKPLDKITLKETIEICISNNCIGSNLATQFKIEWRQCKKLIRKNPLRFSTKESLSYFISRFKMETNKAMHTLERYHQWILLEPDSSK